MNRRGQSTLELILAQLGWAFILLMVVQLTLASRARLQAEVARAAGAEGAGGLQEAREGLQELYPGQMTLSAGACGAWGAPVGVEALDRSVEMSGLRVRTGSPDSALGAGLSIDETSCRAAGAMRWGEVGGDLLDVDPDPWLQGADSRLAPLFN